MKIIIIVLFILLALVSLVRADDDGVIYYMDTGVDYGSAGKGHSKGRPGGHMKLEPNLCFKGKPVNFYINPTKLEGFKECYAKNTR